MGCACSSSAAPLPKRGPPRPQGYDAGDASDREVPAPSGGRRFDDGADRRRALASTRNSNPMAPIAAVDDDDDAPTLPPQLTGPAPAQPHYHARVPSLGRPTDFESRRASAMSRSSRRTRSTDSLGPAWRASINISFDAAMGALARPAMVASEGDAPTTATPSPRSLSRPPGGAEAMASPSGSGQQFHAFGGVPSFAVAL